METETETSHSTEEKLIEELIVGSGALAFKELERMVDVFCPFEAIGMVRQEIRHSNFLSYILNPNRPHEFGSRFLEELLALIIENANEEQVSFSKMDLHFMDMGNAHVLREWRNIDILVELEKSPSMQKEEKSPSMQKGIVIAIELKIDAHEHSDQLQRYKKIIIEQYPTDQWDHVFVFLTKAQTDPSAENLEDWIPIGLDEFITRLVSAHTAHGFSGAASDLFIAYTKMLRRHILENEELKKLARSLWDKHKEALQILIDHKPDIRSDVLDVLWNRRNEMILAESFTIGNFTLTNDTSTRNLLRFTIKEWENIKAMQSGDGTWLESNHLMALEIVSWEDKKTGELKFKASYIIGPGKQEYREILYDQILKASEKGELSLARRRKVISPKWQCATSEVVFSDELAKDIEEDSDPEKIARIVAVRTKEYIQQTLPIYDKIVKAAFLS